MSATTSVDPSHWRRLERAYRTAPINEYFKPTITVRDGEADIAIIVRPDFFHAAAAMHGVGYFKLIDDAAFFAVASRVPDVFVLTAQLTVNFVKPVTDGRLTAYGKITGEEGRRFNAEATIVDESGAIVGHGGGVFVRSKIPLSTIPDYTAEPSPDER